jgi:hypothetical protein
MNRELITMNTLESLVADAKSAPNRSSRDANLPLATRQQLDAFVAWLESTGKTSATARSYRSYMVTALTTECTFDELSSDCKSAARAFARFTQS